MFIRSVSFIMSLLFFSVAIFAADLSCTPNTLLTTQEQSQVLSSDSKDSADHDTTGKATVLSNKKSKRKQATSPYDLETGLRSRNRDTHKQSETIRRAKNKDRRKQFLHDLQQIATSLSEITGQQMIMPKINTIRAGETQFLQQAQPIVAFVLNRVTDMELAKKHDSPSPSKREEPLILQGSVRNVMFEAAQAGTSCDALGALQFHLNALFFS